MQKKMRRWLGKLVVLLIALVYLTSITRNATESTRRSLRFTQEAQGDDRVLILVDITKVDPGARQMTAQLGFLFFGALRQDDQTPKVDLKMLVNNIAGQQEFEFQKGKRLGRIAVTFPMDGDVNRYPFDKYLAFLRFAVTKAGQTKRPPTLIEQLGKPQVDARPSELAIDEASFQGRVLMPVSISILASIPGIKFSREVSPENEPQVTKLDLKVERPSNLILLSLFVMFLMMSLASSVLMMALKATFSSKKFDLLPLSLSLSLIFGLPALRDIQPGVPPSGALADYLSFIWAELFVAVSAIIVMWTWLSNKKQESHPDESGQSRMEAVPPQVEKTPERVAQQQGDLQDVARKDYVGVGGTR